MLNSHTSVLARRVHINSEFSTLPLEAGWAAEAVFFVQAEGIHSALSVATEVSPDGISWIQRGEPVALPSDATLIELPLAVFGNWIRITITGASPETPARVLVHVALKG